MAKKYYISDFLRTTKRGYDATYWIFVLIGSAAVLNQLFGIAGAGAVIIVFLFFYYAGRIHLSITTRRAAHENSDAA